MLASLPIFFVWNPPWACWLMTVYALGANLPCILAQRYNRLAFERMARTRCHARVRR
jgi:glycosyl-4,4'-diaponeurosporenoate acyltransferase